MLYVYKHDLVLLMTNPCFWFQAPGVAGDGGSLPDPTGIR